VSNPGGEIAVTIRGLRKAFGAHEVLRGIDLDIVRGRINTIIGGSGQGKSVIVKHVMGLIKPDAGQILIDGEDIVPMSDYELNRVRRKMATLFQYSALFDSMTVEENVAFPLVEHRRDLGKARIREIVREKLAMLGIAENALPKFPAEISGGMRKRVALARAIVMEPEILVYDEPTTGLDPMTALTVDAEIIKLRDLEGVTSVLVTHQLRDAFYIATHAATRTSPPAIIAAPPEKVEQADFIMLRDGAIAFEGSADELRTSTDPYLREFMS
jgi:phospholipid/cholesterol/gamma-HCH transport system ATP-binding protein